MLALIAYFVTFYLIIKLKRVKIKVSPFPLLKLYKNGVLFHSCSNHKLNLNKEVKTILINTNLYIKTEKEIVVITNIKDVKRYNNTLYFTACGQVKILFNCNDIYKYFAINISSKHIQLSQIKQEAILDLINHMFNYEFSKTTKKFLNIIRNVFNINFIDEKIVVKPNKFRLSFVLTYKVNNTIKRVNVNQIF